MKCFIGVITRLIDQVLIISPCIIPEANDHSFIHTNISDSSVIGVKHIKRQVNVGFFLAELINTH